MGIDPRTIKRILDRIAEQRSGVVKRITSPEELKESPVLGPVIRFIEARRRLTWRDLYGVTVRAVAEATVRGNIVLHVLLDGKRPVKYLFSRRVWSKRVEDARASIAFTRHVVIGVAADSVPGEEDARVFLTCAVGEITEPPRQELGEAAPKIVEYMRFRTEVRVFYLGSAPVKTLMDRKSAKNLVRNRLRALGDKRYLLTGFALEVKRSEKKYDTYVVLMSRGLVLNLVRLAVRKSLALGQLYMTTPSRTAEYNMWIKKLARLPVYRITDRMYFCPDPVLAKYIAWKSNGNLVYVMATARYDLVSVLCPDMVKNGMIYIPLASEVVVEV